MSLVRRFKVPQTEPIPQRQRLLFYVLFFYPVYTLNSRLDGVFFNNFEIFFLLVNEIYIVIPH